MYSVRYVPKEPIEVWLKECPPHIRKVGGSLIKSSDVVTLFKDEPKRLKVYVTIDNDLPSTGAPVVKSGTYSLEDLVQHGYRYLNVVYRYTQHGKDKRRKLRISMKYKLNRWTRLE